MCGLVLIAAKNQNKLASKIDENYCKKIIKKLSHRGPDGEGINIIKNQNSVIALMHRRLSILDLSSNGHQPMSYNKIDIIYNGEIYNFKEIRKNLEQKGYSFSTKTDTEVLLKAYEEYGEKFVSILNGMFSFIILDREKNKLIIARDRFGIKCLYYYLSKDYFIAASEISPILIELRKQLNENVLGGYMRYRFKNSYETFIDEVKEFPIGEYFVLDEKLNCKRISYVKKNISNVKSSSQAQIFEDAERLLVKSLENQLQGDRNVGFLLSGGLDSSLLVSLASRVTSTKIKTFSITFDKSYRFSEGKYQKIVSNFLNTDHKEIIIDHKTYFDHYIYSLSKTNQPFFTLHDPLFYKIALEAKKKVTVLCSGEGADEVFAGYGWHQLLTRKNFIQKNNLGSTINMISKFNKKFLKYGSNKNILTMYDECVSYASNEDLKNFTNFNYVENYTDTIDSSNLNNFLIFDQKTYLRGLLSRFDSMTMLAGIEGRVPYLDNDLVEFINNLSFSKKINMFSNKKILKKISQKYLPKK